MTPAYSIGVLPSAAVLAVILTWCGPAPRDGHANQETTGPRPGADGRMLSHEETLRWIAEHRAWRPARKTKPIWARPVLPEEVGREFQTADHVKQVAQDGAWLSVGVSGEPWFQSRDAIDRKYEPGPEESRRFAFDEAPRTYRLFLPRETARNWAARVEGPGIAGFTIRPSYDPDRPLSSPSGGFVVMEDVPDPYLARDVDVWLVQEPLFKSTYEVIDDAEPKSGDDGKPASRDPP